jgi:hypothetical protein
LEKLQQKYMESRELKVFNNYPPRITTENNLFWMDGSSSMERRKKEHKKIILLGFITCKSFNCKYLRINIFKGGYYDPKGGIYGV